MESTAPGSLQPETSGEVNSCHDWQTWRWEFGDQPNHSPRYATVQLTNKHLGPSQEATVQSAASNGTSPDVKNHTITLGWFHRYPARFSADVLGAVIANAVAKAERPANRILDPFCGTGAVLAASRQIMRQAVGIELTALGQLISQLRLDPPHDVTEALATALHLAQLKPASHSEIGDELEEWIGKLNARRLTEWLNRVATISDVRMRRFLQVAISQSLRPASRWLAGSVKVTADPKRIPRPIEEVLPRFARQLSRDCRAERESTAMAARVANHAVPPAIVLAGDGLHIPIADNAVDVLITSPPYFITYDYFDVHRLTYLAFQWNGARHLQLGAKYGHPPNGRHSPVLVNTFAKWYDIFGREESTLGRALRVYGEGFARHAWEARRVVAPGGAVAYSVANSVRQGQVFDLVSAVQETLTTTGFSAVEALPRPQAGRRILPPGRDTVTGRFAGSSAGTGVREYIVYGVSP